MLEKEYQFYKDNFTDFIKKYEGKFLVIKDTKVQGVFVTYDEAISFAISQYKLGEFLIQECVKEEFATANFINSYVAVNGKTA